MSEARKKLEVLYEDGLGDIEAIVERIEKLFAATGNITTAIKKFNDAEVQMDKKIDDINAAAKVFNKRSYLTLAGAFIITAMAGFAVGYFTFKETLQKVVFEDELKKVSDARLKFEAENQSMMFAKQNGVIFYSDSVGLPTKRVEDLRTTGGDKPGYIYYPYPNNPYKAPKK
ncbi:MAG: hypothetical protein ACXV8Q_00300 [Methylobacter sp.]